MLDRQSRHFSLSGMADNELPEDDFHEEEESHWESAARSRVADALEDIRFDEMRGVIYLLSGEDKHLNRVEEEFENYEEVATRLEEIYDEEWYANVPFDGGEAVWTSDSSGEVGDMLGAYQVYEFFERMRALDVGEEIADARELLQRAGGLVVQADLSEINDELVKYLAEHPEMMHHMNPVKFEELIAALMRAKGYDPMLTKKTGDGGIDIKLFQKSAVGTLLTLVQCKRYAPSNKVTVEAVRQLYGVVEADKATTGLIVTTSTFTKPAQTFQQTIRFRMALADMGELKEWLRNHPGFQ